MFVVSQFCGCTTISISTEVCITKEPVIISSANLSTVPFLMLFVLGSQSSMQNLTTRLAIRIRNLPPNWSATPQVIYTKKPVISKNFHIMQKSRSLLSYDDLMPTSVENQSLFEEAIDYVMEFTLAQLSTLSGFQLKEHDGKNHS